MPKGVYPRKPRKSRNSMSPEQHERASKAFRAIRDPLKDAKRPKKHFPAGIMMDAPKVEYSTEQWGRSKGSLLREIQELKDRIAMLNKELEIATRNFATAEEDARRAERIIDHFLDVS